MKTLVRSALNLLLILTLLLSWSQATPAQAQEDPDKFIARLIAQMTPEAKVGQLFVVTFPGTATAATSDIGDLIINYHVGGVELSTANGNIVNSPDTPTQVAALTNALQNLARTAAGTPATGGRTTPFIPLFVALEQSGNGPPHTQLTGGMSPLPSAMALGATWKPEDAAAIGKTVRDELSAVGVNFLIGPSLDVVDSPRVGGAEKGVDVFGGDPYWVGQMAAGYLRGLRTGGQGGVAAVLTHFPGEGSATDTGDVVDRSLDQLKKIELLPFLSVMQPTAGEQRALADALMTSHVRYRGFQGNIRQRTLPMSVDTQAMQALLAVPEVKAWRDAGGVLVSGPLGEQRLRRYYDPMGLTFPAARIAQEALQANNDILLLSDFGVTNSWTEQLNNIKSTIKSFQDKYSTDLNFQTRVDDAVQRILRLKYRLYPGFDAAAVVVNPAAVPSQVGRSRAITLAVAQDALTQLAPAPSTTLEKPLTVPTAQDSILILTDDRPYKDCATCQTRPLLATDAISQTAARLYPGRLDPARITNASFTNLLTYLNGTTPVSPTVDIGSALGAANWVILAVLNTDSATPQSMALKQLVAQRPNLLSNKKIVIFAFDVPYDLEPDVLSKATAAYALYGRADPFVEVAARALFGEIRPRGYSPVSVEALNYELIGQTEPNPGQVIQLIFGDPPKAGTPTPVPPQVKVGDSLKLSTGTILDRNGHPVPDGTQVLFTRVFSRNVELPAVTATTRGGVATVSFVLDRIGPLLVRASSEPAMTSYTLQLNVDQQPTQPQIFQPPTPTPAPTLTATWTPAPTPTVTATPAPAVGGPNRESRPVEWNDLVLALVGVVLSGGGGYWLQWTRPRRGETSTGTLSRAVRWALWGVLAGLVGYILYGMGLPGSAALRAMLGTWTALVVVLVFGSLPLLTLWLEPFIQQSLARGRSG